MSKNLVWSSTNVIKQVAQRPAVQDIPTRDLMLRYLSLTLEKLTDTDEYQFDYLVDAGVSNIVAFCNTVNVGGTDRTFFVPSSLKYDIKADVDGRMKYWKKTCDLFVDFCKRRQDCLAILDSPRPLTLDGNAKKVRRTNAEASFYRDIGSRMRYVPVVNSQFGCMFFNWWQPATMENTSEQWLPPSILAAEVYCREPFWRAPAGLNYGTAPNVRDISVNPSKGQQSLIYDNRMNFFVVERGVARIEGQKTLYAKSSAFDRVNVRRLFNFMNRSVGRILKFFVYEPNNAYTRARVVDTLDVLMSRLVSLQAVYDYRIVCDETLNTPSTLDRNEMRVILVVKPAKTVEFLKASFVATRTDANLADVYANLTISDSMNW